MEVRTETNIENMKLGVQETLDELFSARLIPFKLTAYKVNADGPGEYVARFQDSRVHSIRFFRKDGESFREAVRTSALDLVKRMRLRHYRMLSAASRFTLAATRGTKERKPFSLLVRYTHSLSRGARSLSVPRHGPYSRSR